MSFEYDYAIITIDDRRKDYKTKLRKNLTTRKEVFIDCVDGRHIDISKMMKEREIEFSLGWVPTRGEFGIWMSSWNHWDYVSKTDKALVVFEDDAIIHSDFDYWMTRIGEQLPNNWDYMALWVPDNQKIDYMYACTYNHHGHRQINGRVTKQTGSSFNINKPDLARVYQGYGMVAMMYSPRGGEKIIEVAQKTGLYTPVDCFIHERANAWKFAHPGEERELYGYAPKPHYTLAEYDWPETTIHNTERVIIES